MQDLPGAPGTARQGSTRTIVSINDGGRATQPRAPSHERPLAAQRAAGHGWLSAALEAPGADVPLAMTAGAPGQHCLSAALQVPGADLPLAIPARAPGHHRLSAAPIATVPSPAGLRRLRQEVLPRVPANPRTPTHPHSHCLNRHSRLPPRHSRESGNPRPPLLRGDHRGATHRQPAARPPKLTLTYPPTTPPTTCILPSKYRPARGLAPPRVRAFHRSISPAPHRLQVIAACAAIQPSGRIPCRGVPCGRPRVSATHYSPSLPGKGPGDRSKPHHTWHYPCGFGLSGVRSNPPHPSPCTAGGP